MVLPPVSVAVIKPRPFRAQSEIFNRRSIKPRPFQAQSEISDRRSTRPRPGQAE